MGTHSRPPRPQTRRQPKLPDVSNWTGIVARRTPRSLPSGLHYSVDVEITVGTNGERETRSIPIARFYHEGDCFTYGQIVAKRANIEFRSYL